MAGGGGPTEYGIFRGGHGDDTPRVRDGRCQSTILCITAAGYRGICRDATAILAPKGSVLCAPRDTEMAVVEG